MDARDAFMKLREQIKICMQSPAEVRAALNLVNSTNLEYFNNQHKAELFRLKGETLQHLGLGDESNTAFSAALSVCDNYSKGWISWGLFSDRVFALKKDRQWAEYAVSCYLQAVAYRSKKARLMLTRVLWLLSYDQERGPVNLAFERYSPNLPAWNWLLWIPQLLSSLARPEGNPVKDILCKIAAQYPQSLYYTIRAFLIERRELRNMMGVSRSSNSSSSNQSSSRSQEDKSSSSQAAAASSAANKNAAGAQANKDPLKAGELSKKGSGTDPQQKTKETTEQQQQQQQQQQQAGPAGQQQNPVGGPQGASKPAPQQQPQQPTSDQLVEEVVRVLREHHASLVTEVERMLDEIGKRFKPEPEEELLGAVHALFLKCFKQKPSPQDEIPRSLQSTIEKVCKKFFTDNQMGNKRHSAFVHKYKSSFEKCFLSREPQGQAPKTLSQLTVALKRWKHHLKCTTDARLRRYGHGHTGHLSLERLSPYLIRFETYDIEIPGQYFKDEEPTVDANIILDRFEPDVMVYHSHGFSHRRIGLRGSNGKVYHFLVQYSISHITRSDERMMQFYVILNRLMAKYKETRKRNLVYHVPLVVPLTHRLRLMESLPSQVTLEEILEQDCANRGEDIDASLVQYREFVRKQPKVDDDKKGRQQHKKQRLTIYREICENTVRDDILTRFIQRTLPSPEQVWAFRTQLGYQLAISGFLGFTMNIGDRALHKITVCRKSGRVTQSEFYPAYNSNMLIDSEEHVKFRLTRNLSKFLNSFIVAGVFGSTLIASSACLLKHQEILKNYLYLYIRDDLLSWNATRLPIQNDAAQHKLEQRLRDKISTNTLHILKRVNSLMQSSQAVNSEPVPINRKVEHLIADAMSEEHLCLMPAPWLPWF